MATTSPVVLGALLALICISAVPALAGGSPLSVDAGPAQVIAFPATDLTLFGRASDGANGPLAVHWALVNGPAPVKFSAPNALTTTATFLAEGTYVLRLAARGGTSEAASTVTVTVNPASSQRAFYVDPDYAGKGDGTATVPWTALGMSATNPQWKAINEALAHGPVIVYFSAREAGADTPEETTEPINILRTDKSTNRLTIDGMSRYNTDDAHPSWVDYAGPCRTRVKILGSEWFAIGVTSKQCQYPMNHVTVRGFETTGNAARVVYAGSYSVVEHLYIHDIMKDGANLQFDVSVDSDGTELFGRCTDITIRNNLIERGVGEAIYFGGNYRRKSDGGWPEYGNTHSNILIEGNTARDPGYNGGQGEGLDLKTGLRNVTVRSNVVERCHPEGTAGITCDGVFGDVRSDYLIEGNRVSGGSVGIYLSGQNGVTIRNNVLHDNAAVGISLSGQQDLGVVNRDVQVYNNTVYWNEGGGISIGDSDGVVLKNNLVFDNNCRWRPNEGGGPRVPQITISDSTTHVTSDYNLLSAPGPGWEGPHSIIASDADGWLTDSDGLVADLALRDLHLAPLSRAIDKGADLSATGHAFDFDGVSRPQGRGWDIGAYEWKDSSK